MSKVIVLEWIKPDECFNLIQTIRSASAVENISHHLLTCFSDMEGWAQPLQSYCNSSIEKKNIVLICYDYEKNVV